MYVELELRVGNRLANAMSDEQMSRFEMLVEAKDQAVALAFLNAELLRQL